MSAFLDFDFLSFEVLICIFSVFFFLNLEVFSLTF